MTAARQAALDYFEAWTTNNTDALAALIADDIVVDAPSGRIEGTQASSASPPHSPASSPARR